MQRTGASWNRTKVEGRNTIETFVRRFGANQSEHRPRNRRSHGASRGARFRRRCSTNNWCLRAGGLRDYRSHAVRLPEPDQYREQMGDQNEQLFRRLLHYQFATGIQDCPQGRASMSVLQFAYFTHQCAKHWNYATSIYRVRDKNSLGITGCRPKRSWLSLCRAKSKAVPGLLGAVHGGIRRLDESVCIAGVCRINRDADAGSDVDALLLTAELERRS